MTIVLNEHDWAEDMILNHTLGKKPFETMCRVARYYIDNGMSKRDVRMALESFLLQSDPTVSIPKWADLINSAINFAAKHPAINVEAITISKDEMARIDSLNGKQVRRLAFTLLCLSKYWNCVLGRNDGWINNKDSDIMRMANINTSIKRQSLMFYNLREAGLIEFSRKVDNTNVRVTLNETGEAAMHVTDFRNLGYQYKMYHGGQYFVCANCGITEKYENPNRGRKQKYCKSCAAKVMVRNRVNYSMRRAEATSKRAKQYTVYMHKFPNGNVYIGATSQDLKDRWRNGAGYRWSKVGEAIEECGWDNVRHYILFNSLDRGRAQNAEAFFINKYQSYLPQFGYNEKSMSSCYDATEDSHLDILELEVDGDGRPVVQQTNSGT